MMTMIALPHLDYAAVNHKTTEAVAHRIVTALRRVRAMAIRDAVVNPLGYGLELVGHPVQAVVLEDLQSGQTLETLEIPDSIRVEGIDGKTLGFTPLGALADGSARSICIQAGQRTIVLSVVPATGSVRMDPDNRR